MLATQCLVQARPRTMRICYSGAAGPGVTAKDLILATIGRLGTSGMAGHAVEYAGEAIRGRSMENRMTICNMTIEGGGRAGMIAPDESTFAWVEGRRASPADLDAAVAGWRDVDRRRCRVPHGGRHRRRLDLADGHLGDEREVVEVTGVVPEPSTETEERALRYMELSGPRDPRDPARPRVHRVVHQPSPATCGRRHRWSRGGASQTRPAPWSSRARPSRRRAESEGLDEVFRAAGFDWRSAGCSMCLGMNPDILSPGSAAHRRRTATSRAARARAAGRTSVAQDGSGGRHRGYVRRHPGVGVNPVT